MSEYNSKNYFAQGGEELVIGGKLTINTDGSGGGLMPNQEEDSTGSTASLKAALNALLRKLKNAGLMTGDAFSVSVNNNVNDQTAGHADRTYNTGKISSVAIADNVITITLSVKVKDLKDFDGGGGWGVYKWLGFSVNAGVSPITGLKFNDIQMTNDDVTEATAMGLSAGNFVLWVKADRIIEGASNTFTLWADGKTKTTYTLKIVEPDE